MNMALVNEKMQFTQVQGTLREMLLVAMADGEDMIYYLNGLGNAPRRSPVIQGEYDRIIDQSKTIVVSPGLQPGESNG
jgi:hypothetical protein